MQTDPVGFASGGNRRSSDGLAVPGRRCKIPRNTGTAGPKGQPMESTKLIDQIVGAYLKPSLQSTGFRKRGATFWRDHGRMIDVVNLQKSRWNDSRSASFTVNLGIYWKHIHELLGESVKTFPPKEFQCTVRERLGRLFNLSPEFPNGRDSWWEVTEASDLATIGADVVNRIHEFGIPWLERLHDLEAVMAHLKAHRLYRRDDTILELHAKGQL